VAPRSAGFGMRMAPKNTQIGTFGRVIDHGNGLEETERGVAIRDLESIEQCVGQLELLS